MHYLKALLYSLLQLLFLAVQTVAKMTAATILAAHKTTAAHKLSAALSLAAAHPATAADNSNH